jgi:hypothetical protein
VRGTQWNTQVVVAGNRLLHVRTGLDYGALGDLAAGLDPPVKLTETVMDGLRLMEAYAVAIFDRRNARLLKQG